MCIYTFIYTCVHVYVYIDIYTHTHTRICICICICLCLCTRICIGICMCTCVCVCICICIRICICIGICACGVVPQGGLSRPAPRALCYIHLVTATCYILPVADLRFSEKPCLKVAKLVAKTHMKLNLMPAVMLACGSYPHAKHRLRYVMGMQRVCNRVCLGYVARWFHNATCPCQEGLALESWASYYNALVPTLEGGFVAKGAV